MGNITEWKNCPLMKDIGVCFGDIATGSLKGWVNQYMQLNYT